MTKELLTTEQNTNINSFRARFNYTICITISFRLLERLKGKIFRETISYTQRSMEN